MLLHRRERAKRTDARKDLYETIRDDRRGTAKGLLEVLQKGRLLERNGYEKGSKLKLGTPLILLWSG
jgi:hypothetical protein